MKRPFSKPSTTHIEQVELLRQRGMLIDNEKEAIFYLRHLNYYRLAAYWRPFEVDHSTHQFQQGVTFEMVLDRYRFDRELRLHLLDAIERIEVSIRSIFAYQMAHRHGPHAHLDSSLARHSDFWQKNLNALKDQVYQSRHEPFIDHFRKNHTEDFPPIWAVCEVMSVGLLSRMYKNLEPIETRRAIAKVYGIDDSDLASWLHHLSVVRNTCAHHARLWDRDFSIKNQLPAHPPKALRGVFSRRRSRIHNTLTMLLYFMDRLAPQHHWRTRLLALIDDHRAPVGQMGFPENWRELPIWQEASR